MLFIRYTNIYIYIHIHTQCMSFLFRGVGEEVGGREDSVWSGTNPIMFRSTLHAEFRDTLAPAKAAASCTQRHAEPLIRH